MHLKLKNFSAIISGYSFRGAIKPAWESNVFVIQARNIFSEEAIKDSQNLIPISYEGARGPAFLEKGDVLVVSRGAGRGSFRATVFDSATQNILATSSLLIIRLVDKKVSPEYLAAYLNSDQGQEKLLQTVSGSYIQAISRLKLEELEIPIPTIQKQELLIKLYQNIQRQQKIKERQEQLYKQVINSAFSNLTRE